MQPQISAVVATRGMRLGKYQVIAHIATGGMGAVYRARDIDLGRDVALKILPHELAGRPDLVERFRREARHAARLNHENIVTLYEFGEAQQLYYLAMEFIDGVDLGNYIREQGKLDPDEAHQIILQATSALEHSFEQGIVHRDIKPSNFLLSRRGEKLIVKLTDLGIAREVEAEEHRVTGAGLTVGTIDYMSPEQARDSRAADIRSDIYSLGCTLYHMLAGQPPFIGTVTELVFKHLEEEPTEIREINKKVSPGMAHILNKMLAKDPNARYQTPTELLRDLGRMDELGLKKKRLDKPEQGTQEEMYRRRAHAEMAPRKSMDEQIRDDRDATLVPNPTPRQHRVAVGQFERANEALNKENYDYGIRLLLSCCKLDPANLPYRQALRQAVQASQKKQAKPGAITAFLVWLLRARIKAAMRAKCYLKVLEYGEQLLIHQYDDVSTQLDMAQAAHELKLLSSAIWILEQVNQKSPQAIAARRMLAQLYEERQDFREAIAVWESIRRTNPTDTEAMQKTKDLAASETIARGGYLEALERPRSR